MLNFLTPLTIKKTYFLLVKNPDSNNLLRILVYEIIRTLTVNDMSYSSISYTHTFTFFGFLVGRLSKVKKFYSQKNTKSHLSIFFTSIDLVLSRGTIIYYLKSTAQNNNNCTQSLVLFIKPFSEGQGASLYKYILHSSFVLKVKY